MAKEMSLNDWHQLPIIDFTAQQLQALTAAHADGTQVPLEPKAEDSMSTIMDLVDAQSEISAPSQGMCDVVSAYACCRPSPLQTQRP